MFEECIKTKKQLSVPKILMIRKWNAALFLWNVDFVRRYVFQAKWILPEKIINGWKFLHQNLQHSSAFAEGVSHRWTTFPAMLQDVYSTTEARYIHVFKSVWGAC